MATRFNTLFQLFDVIQHLPLDTQAALVKRIYKGRLDQCLRRAILDLSHEEQVALLHQLDQMVAVDTPEAIADETTLDLDERQAPRKKCYLPVNYTAEDQTFENNILDISTLGVFIETFEPLAVGQQMIMRFAFPGNNVPIEVKGRIIWKGDRGVGVEFVEPGPDIIQPLRRYIDQI